MKRTDKGMAIFKEKSRRIMFTVFTALAALCLFCAIGAVEAMAAETDTAASNIYIENICVAGMNEEEINAVIELKMSEYSASVITLNVGEQSVDVTAGELGLYQTNTGLASKILRIGNSGNIWERYTVNKALESGEELIFSLDTAVSEESVRIVVQEKAGALNIERVDMSLAMGEGGSLYTTSAQDGITLNEDDAVSQICAYMNDEWFGGYGEINLSVTVDEASGDSEVFAQVTDIIGSGSTSFEGSASGRITNIQLATSKINGTVLLPGEEFSALELMEPFTEEEGYALAAAIELGEYVESYGGGVCQVSSTLYRAVLEAELEVTQRSAHSLMVEYVDPSLDAAVASGVKDFKFVNNTDYPIYIQGYTSGYTLVFNIYGCETRDAGRTLDFYGEITREIEMETVYELDSSLSIGSYQETAGSSGNEAQGYKVVYQDGVEVSREAINYSVYNVKDHEIIIGTGGATAEQLSQLQAAIAMEDETQIMATVRQITGGLALSS